MDDTGVPLSQRALIGVCGASGGPAGQLPLNKTWRDSEVAAGVTWPIAGVFYSWDTVWSTHNAELADWEQRPGRVLHVCWIPAKTSGVVLLTDIVAGVWDTHINQMLAGMAAWGHRVVCRWGHEMNGNWYKWSMAYAGPNKGITNVSEYIAAWRYIVAKGRVQAPNVDWYFNANGADVGGTTMESYYPGNAWVDVIGYDAYNTYGAWMTPFQTWQPAYDRVAAMHPSAPIWIGETGCREDDADTKAGGSPDPNRKATWVAQMFAETHGSRLEAVNYFNTDGGHHWKFDTSVVAQTAFQTGFASMARYDALTVGHGVWPLLPPTPTPDPDTGIPLRQRALFGVNGPQYGDGAPNSYLHSTETMMNVAWPVVGLNFTFDTVWASEQANVNDLARRQGRVLYVTWKPEKAVGTVSLTAITAGSFDTHINQFMAGMAAYPYRIVCRLAHEQNGNSYPWSTAYVGSNKGITNVSQYIAMWRYIVAKGRTQCPNVRWLFCANGDDVGSDSVEDYYPGSSYVDLIGVDAFNFYDHWKTPFQTWEPMYTRLCDLHTTADFWIAETASKEDPAVPTRKADWAAQMFAETRLPRITHVIYLDIPADYPWQFETSAQSLAAFRAGYAASINPNAITAGYGVWPLLESTPPPPGPPLPTSTARSWPSPTIGDVVFDAEHELLMGAIAGGGLLDPAGSAPLVYADGVSRSVRLRSGRMAWVHGHVWESGPVDLALPVAENGTGGVRKDLVILGLNRESWDVEAYVKAGLAQFPPLQRDALRWEVPIGELSVPANAPVISSANLLPTQAYLGQPIVLCTPTTSPPPSLGVIKADEAGIVAFGDGNGWWVLMGAPNMPTGTYKQFVSPGQAGLTVPRTYQPMINTTVPVSPKRYVRITARASITPRAYEQSAEVGIVLGNTYVAMSGREPLLYPGSPTTVECVFFFRTAAGQTSLLLAVNVLLSPAPTAPTAAIDVGTVAVDVIDEGPTP